MNDYTTKRLEEFEETTLVTKAGSWLECSDYEGTVNEMRVFLSISIAQALAEERERVEEIIKGSNTSQTRLMEKLGDISELDTSRIAQEAYYVAKRDILSSISPKSSEKTEEINNKLK